MAVRQRGDSYQADFSYKGKNDVRPKRYRKDFTSKQEAEAWEIDTKARLNRGLVVSTKTASHDPQCLTMEDLMKRTIDGHWAGSKSEHTARINAEDCVNVLGRTRPINTVTVVAIDELKASFRRRGLTGGTINRKLAALSTMLRYAADRDWIVGVPKISRCKESEHRLRWLTAEEEKAVLDWLKFKTWHSFADLVTLLVDSGLRLSEALQLHWQDAEQGLLMVWADASKNGASRSVPQTQRVREIIARRKAAVPAGELRVFWDVDYWEAEYKWRMLREHMKLDDDPQFVIHMLRHTFCSRLAQRGVNLQVIQQLAGHKTVTVTQRYSHLHPGNLVDAVRLLDGAAPDLSNTAAAG